PHAARRRAAGVTHWGPMAEPFRIVDLGDHRVLRSDRGEWSTHYSERIIRLLIERKGLDRAPLYFPFKKERAPRFLDPLFGCRRVTGASRSTSTTAWWPAAATWPSSTHPTARSPSRRTRSACRSPTGCRRAWPGAPRVRCARTVIVA